MKIRNLVTILGSALLLCACIPSVNPFYKDKDIVSEPRLFGEWEGGESADDKQIWKFEDAGDKTYKLTIIENAEGKKGQFTTRLFKLGQEQFLDLVPSDCEYATNQADIVAASMFPGHLLVHVSQIEPSLKLAFFDFDWLEKLLKQDPKALANHREGDRIILTASTTELQRFVLKHLREGKLFAEPGEMFRKSSGSTGQR